jgi:hypothetical protein
MKPPAASKIQVQNQPANPALPQDTEPQSEENGKSLLAEAIKFNLENSRKSSKREVAFCGKDHTD